MPAAASCTRVYHARRARLRKSVVVNKREKRKRTKRARSANSSTKSYELHATYVMQCDGRTSGGSGCIGKLQLLKQTRNWCDFHCQYCELCMAFYYFLTVIAAAQCSSRLLTLCVCCADCPAAAMADKKEKPGRVINKKELAEHNTPKVSLRTILLLALRRVRLTVSTSDAGSLDQLVRQGVRFEQVQGRSRRRCAVARAVCHIKTLTVYVCFHAARWPRGSVPRGRRRRDARV